MATGTREIAEKHDAARPAVPGGSGAPYDVERIRADFPILFREVYGKPLVYLDNGASAQKPRAVLEAMEHAYQLRIRQRASRPALSVEHGDRQASRTRARPCAASSTPAAPTRSSSRATPPRRSTSSPAPSAAGIGEGDEIVLSIMEHHSNIVPWHFHRERNGAVLKWAPISDSGEFLLDEFEQLLTPRTKMVAITHMSNVLGTRGADQGGHPPRARPRHPGAGRRQPGGGAHAGRRAGPRLPTSTSSPATRPTAPPASACCTPRRRISTPCRPTRAAAT